MMRRYSSRRSPLKDFLATRLQGARRYDRIAGFFSSSLLEVAGEALERMTLDDGETCVRGEWDVHLQISNQHPVMVLSSHYS